MMSKKILVFGAGVIGSVYAVRLAEAGNDVTVLARGKRLEALRSGGLRIRNLFLDEGEETAEIKVAVTLAPGTEFDAVLVTVRSGQIMDVLTRLQQERITARAIVVIGNNLGNLDEQAGLVGNDRFIAGFGAFGGYEEDGVICYLDGRTREKSEKSRRSKTTTGIIDASARPALTLLHEIFSGAGIPTVENNNIRSYLLYHAALVFPLAGAMYAAGGDQESFCDTRDAIVLGVRGCHECFAALRALGYPLEPKSLRTLIMMPERYIVSLLSKKMRGESARIAMFGHANAPGGRSEIGGQASVLDAVLRASGKPMPSWNRLLPYFDPNPKEPQIPNGSGKIKLKIW